MPEKNLQPIEMQICIGLIRIGEIENDKLTAERISALFTISGLCRAYHEQFNSNPLMLHICEKKITFILQAKSKSELDEILSLPKVRYNFNEVVPVGNFHIEEEELLIWSLTSLWCGGPLNQAGFNRYMKLFKKFYPDMADEIGI